MGTATSFQAHPRGQARSDVTYSCSSPFIDTEGPAVAADQLDLVVAAFESLNPELEYEVPDDVKRLLAENPGRLTELSADGTPQRATAALTQLGVSLADIRALPPAAQRSVVVARRYEVNAPNLEVAVGGGDIALDAIMQLEDPTFDHVLGHFEAYLSSIDASHRPSITDVDMAVDVMEGRGAFKGRRGKRDRAADARGDAHPRHQCSAGDAASRSC